jgi:hypothetical protein
MFGRNFGELIEHLRGDVRKIDEPKAQALFETRCGSDQRSGDGVQTLRREERASLEMTDSGE